MRRKSGGWVPGLLAGFGAGILYAVLSYAVNAFLLTGAGNENVRAGHVNVQGCGVNVVVVAFQLALIALVISLLTSAGRRRLFGAERGDRLAEFWTFFAIGICCPFLPCSVAFSLFPLVGNCAL